MTPKSDHGQSKLKEIEHGTRRMSTPDVARRRLFNQQLVGARSKEPEDVVRWLVAVQAQDYAGAKWALGIRLPSATDDDIEKAFTAGHILRTHVLRPTWHFVTPSDIRWLLALTAPRVQAANAFMYRRLGLDSAVFTRSNDALSKALQGGQQRTRDELREVLERAGIGTEGAPRMAYLMMRAELDGVVCSGPRRGKRFTYMLLDERVPPGRFMGRSEALAELAFRYFMSRGPATINDFAKWSGLTVADARSGLEDTRHRLVQEAAGGKTYWLSPSKAAASALTEPTAHLLWIYDEYISGYKDWSAIASERVGARLSALGNSLSHIVVVGGQVVGTWKPRIERHSVVVGVDIFRRLTKAEDRAISAAAVKYGDFLGMPVRLERGSAHLAAQQSVAAVGE